MFVRVRRKERERGREGGGRGGVEGDEREVRGAASDESPSPSVTFSASLALPSFLTQI